MSQTGGARSATRGSKAAYCGLVFALTIVACQPATDTVGTRGPACNPAAESASQAGPGCERAWIDANLKMNDIQVLGTHNSYKDWIAPDEFKLLSEVAPQTAPPLEYAHETLTAQLDWGIRQFEIDIVHDPVGGVYLDPLIRRRTLAAGGASPDLAFQDELARPGFKVMHVPDIDYRTTCPTLVACLSEVRAWSLAHPDHAPMFVMLNTKDTPASWEGATPVAPFDAAAWDALDAEVLSVFPKEALITPADVQGTYSTIRDAVLADAWPKLGDARGRVMFGILAGRESTAPYRLGPKGAGGMAARPMFVRAEAGDDDAAWLMWDDPIANIEAIKSAVADGFLVRTRTEQDTVEARSGDTVKREAAFASGGQFISTDYYKPNPDFGDYAVAMPGGAVARCNPLRVPDACGDAVVE